MYKNLIIGGSGKLGKYISFPKSLFTYNKKKIPNAVWLNTDFKRFKEIYKSNSFENIFFIAGVTDIDKCRKNLKQSKKINVDFPKKIINFLKKKQTKFIYFSTDQVYGNSFNAKEKNKLKPLNIYAKQKVLIEKEIRKNLKNFLILRLSRVVLENDNHGDFISSFLKNIKYKRNIFACSNYCFNFIFSSYLTKSVKFLVKNNMTGIFNIGGSTVLSFFDIFLILKKKLISSGYDSSRIKLIKIRIEDLRFKEERAKYINLNTKKLSKIYKNPPNSNLKLAQIVKKKLNNFNLEK